MNTLDPATAGPPDPLAPAAEPERRDNLTTMLFVAALFHGVLILGISFTGELAPSTTDSAESLEVVLLTRDYEKRAAPEDAEYLAQQNLSGSGNTTADEGLRVAYGTGNTSSAPGPEQQGRTEPETFSPAQSPLDPLYADTPEAAALRIERGQEQPPEPVATGMPGRANTVEILAAPDSETVLRSAEPGTLVISANTRESRIAAYLDGWKRRVERVGTMNFPRRALLNSGSGHPVLEVDIAADGSLRNARIVVSSGNRELDMAAINILRMAAPFDPFPEYLRNDYDGLKFSYEWKFTAGSVGRMTVP